MFATPAEKLVIKPAGVTDATLTLSLSHTPPAGDELNVVVAPLQIDAVPVIEVGALITDIDFTE